MEKINIPKPPSGFLRYDEPMASHTTFRVGGPADVWVRPGWECFPRYAAELLGFARREGIPILVLGGGANLVVADRGIRGIVLDTGDWLGWEQPARGQGHVGDKAIPEAAADDRGASTDARVEVSIRSGTPVDDFLNAAADQGWGGIEFLAGMPGSLGGAVWMNARCQGHSISEALTGVEILDESLNRRWIPYRPEDYAYKRSPFQRQDTLILSAGFALRPGDPAELRRTIQDLRRGREEKGQFRFPSAGSVFKNDQALGKPSGKIIDELGLRGLSSGGAKVAPWHGNFIINTGKAAASDIRTLTRTVAARVRDALGISLEPEILFVGDWGEDEARGGIDGGA
jgi:UDP-N-acetylmuramate dehydrogenase